MKEKTNNSLLACSWYNPGMIEIVERHHKNPTQVELNRQLAILGMKYGDGIKEPRFANGAKEDAINYAKAVYHQKLFEVEQLDDPEKVASKLKVVSRWVDAVVEASKGSWKLMQTELRKEATKLMARPRNGSNGFNELWLSYGQAFLNLAESL